MTRTARWHSTRSDVCHDDTACTEGNDIEPKNRQPVAGGYGVVQARVRVLQPTMTAAAAPAGYESRGDAAAYPINKLTQALVAVMVAVSSAAVGAQENWEIGRDDDNRLVVYGDAQEGNAYTAIMCWRFPEQPWIRTGHYYIHFYNSAGWPTADLPSDGLEVTLVVDGVSRQQVLVVVDRLLAIANWDEQSNSWVPAFVQSLTRSHTLRVVARGRALRFGLDGIAPLIEALPCSTVAEPS